MRPSLKITLASLLFAAGAAQAATITYTSALIAPDYTDWDDSFYSLQKFDPSMGMLNSITFKLWGTVQGDIGVESTDRQATTITANLSGTLTLYRPDTSVLVVTTPLSSLLFMATAYDGNTNFAGSSGETLTYLPFTTFNSATTSSAADKALFTGAGTVLTPIFAVGTSNASGSGNLATYFDTMAGAQAQVTYDYTAAPIPEPGTLALMFGGLAMLGFMAKRRRQS